jgi:uroporphyrin-III C-methyltransferase/precorrin-2 dehydrogenase/sirohydrochlorin ferrochelatase
VRGLRALQRADVVLYDSLIDPSMLEGLRAETVHVGKRCGRHSMPQETINDLLVGYARRGRQVVRLKGGDPAVLGRVGEEALYLAEHGVEFEIVPGVTSAVAAPIFAGIPVTHRGIADSFVVVSAHRTADATDFSIPPYHARTTAVLLMATVTVEAWRDELVARGYPPDLPLAFVSRAGTPAQCVLVTDVAHAADVARVADLPSPTMAVAGWVVTLRERLGAAAVGSAEGGERDAA